MLIVLTMLQEGTMGGGTMMLGASETDSKNVNYSSFNDAVSISAD
jgi:hypothetical protein